MVWNGVAGLALLLAGVAIGLALRGPGAERAERSGRAAVARTSTTRRSADLASTGVPPADAPPADAPPADARSASLTTHPGHRPVELDDRLESPDPAEPPALPVPSEPLASEPSVPEQPGSADGSPPGASEPVPAARQDGATRTARRRTFFQDVRIQRSPTFVMQGLTIPQQLEYRIVSRVEIEPPGADGTCRVIQYVEATHLREADELSRAALGKSLAGLEHQQYTYTLNARREVTDFQGPRHKAAALPVDMRQGQGRQGQGRQGQGFMVTSIIDDDGWKELAQLTFFQPDGTLRAGRPVRRSMTHDWGTLGSWYGETEFFRREAGGESVSAGSVSAGSVSAGSDASRTSATALERFDYVHKMSYVAPAKDQGLLPFRITKAEFETIAADGTILFDPRRDRVVEVRERFEVRGVVATEVLGQPATIRLQEQQLITIHVTDERPKE